MKPANKPFWEDSYKRPGKLDTFGGGKPSSAVVTVACNMKPGLSALDLGCGEGRNALYLASIGFVTTAVDISESGIDKLNTVADEQNLKIDALVCNMRDYGFDKEFDLIVCLGCLHLIKQDEWQSVIANMKQATSKGGLHVVGVLTDTIPEPEDQRGLMVGLFRDGELYSYYKDWDIIQTKSSEFEDEHPDGPRHKHSANSIIAKRP